MEYIHIVYLVKYSFIMDPSDGFDVYKRFENFPENYRNFCRDLYDKFKSYCAQENKRLIASIVMLISSVIHYKGSEYELDVKNFDETKMNMLQSCFSKNIPEPGTFYGIQMCQMYNMPRQQNNLNVKKPKRDSDDVQVQECTSVKIDYTDGDRWLDETCCEPINRPIYSSENFRENVEKFHASDKNDLFLSMSQPKVVYTSIMIKTNKGSREFKNIVGECLKFSMCLELKKITTTSITLIAYHTNKSFFERFLCTLYRMYGPESVIMWFTNERTTLTKKFNGDFFVKNYIDYLYCFLTNRFEPDVPKTINDIVTLMMCKLISGIIKSIGFVSLKSTGLYKARYPPMSLVTAEASLLNVQKLISDKDRSDKEYKVYAPLESMFLNCPVTRDSSILLSNYNSRYK